MRRLSGAMLAWIFMYSGLDVLRNPGPRVASAAALLDRLTALPFVPDDRVLLVRANAVLHVGAGAMLATGVLPRTAAACLAASLVPTTYGGHPFWRESDPARRAMQRTHFNKNLSMLGGLLSVAAGPSHRAEGKG